MCWGDKRFIEREWTAKVFAEMIKICRNNARLRVRMLSDPINEVWAERQCILTVLELADMLGLRTAATPHRTGVFKSKLTTKALITRENF